MVTLQSAMAHLHHFCAKLTPEPYVDNRPLFSYDKANQDDCFVRGIQATVGLPSSIEASLREARGKLRWRTEKAARKDAAFQAYMQLYVAGLINDHLLPLGNDRTSEYPMTKTSAGIQEVNDLINPWKDALVDNQTTQLRQTLVKLVEENNEEELVVRMYTKVQDLPEWKMQMYWNRSIRYQIRLEASTTTEVTVEADKLHLLQRTTDLFLRYTQMATPSTADSPLPFFVGPDMDFDRLRGWLHENEGYSQLGDLKLRDIYAEEEQRVLRYRGGKVGLLRSAKLDLKTSERSIWAIQLPKRCNFSIDPRNVRSIELSTVPDEREDDVEKAGTEIELVITPDVVHHYTLDSIAPAYSRFALLLPTVLYSLTQSMTASELRHKKLGSVHLSSQANVLQAITASSASNSHNYQRLELLGDSILKFLIARYLFSKHPAWPEAYLSQAKDSLVSNSRLTRAALEAGLDRYIITKAFAARKWRFAELADSRTARTRELSSKVLADVVEALIGAAYLDGGLDEAAQCIALFLPEVDLSILLTTPTPTPPPYPPSIPPTLLMTVNNLTGHTFAHRALLLESLTHPSHELDPSATSSYQRLEFLGDALLDFLVITRLYNFPPHVSHGYLHLVKTALVNANFLAHCNLSLTTVESLPRILVERGTGGAVRPREIGTERSLGLYSLLRHGSADLLAAQAGVRDRHAELGPQIDSALEAGDIYPWTQLTTLDAPKPLSDVMESMLAALYLDNAALMPCETFLERAGVWNVLQRIREQAGAGKMRVMHPKEELGILAGERTVEYRAGREVGGTWWVEVGVGGEVLGRVEGVRGRVEAETKAAELAGGVLKEKVKEEVEAERERFEQLHSGAFQ